MLGLVGLDRLAIVLQHQVVEPRALEVDRAFEARIVDRDALALRQRLLAAHHGAARILRRCLLARLRRRLLRLLSLLRLDLRLLGRLLLLRLRDLDEIHPSRS